MEGYRTVGGNLLLFRSVLTTIVLNLEAAVLHHLVKKVLWLFLGLGDSGYGIHMAGNTRGQKRVDTRTGAKRVVAYYCTWKGGRSQPHLLPGWCLVWATSQRITHLWRRRHCRLIVVTADLILKSVSFPLYKYSVWAVGCSFCYVKYHATGSTWKPEKNVSNIFYLNNHQYAALEKNRISTPCFFPLFFPLYCTTSCFLRTTLLSEMMIDW